MSVMEEGSEPRGEPRLQVWIGNNDPIAAEQLGKFIREFAVDYRRQTEGQLVLARLELGSTFLEFADQTVAYSNYVAAPLVFMEAAKRMGQFYKFLAKQLKGPSDDQLLLPPPIEPSPARLLEIVANAKADLRIIQVAEVKTIELKFPEVLMRNEAAKIKKKKRKKPLPQKEEYTIFQLNLEKSRNVSGRRRCPIRTSWKASSRSSLGCSGRAVPGLR